MDVLRLIFSTGHGKGTLGNFLFNLRMPKEDGSLLFEESENLDPHTQEPYYHNREIENSPNAPDDRKSKRFIILDTPGLNDVGREKDLRHMIAILEMIKTQFQSVNMLVLVYRLKARADAATGPALRYYRDLFAPLFQAQKVILVLTFASSEDYEMGVDETWDSTIQEHLDACNRMLELEKPEWNCRIVNHYFVNSKWAPRKIDELLRKIAAKEEFDKNDLLYRSYLMREQILNYISEACEIPLETYRVSLPPTLETERVGVLTVIDGRIQELLKAVLVEDEYRGDKLKQMEQLRRDLTDERNNTEKCKTEIHRLSAVQKTRSEHTSGDDWIKFRSAGMYSVQAPCDPHSPCGGCIMNYKYENHNAMHSPHSPKTDGRTWKVKVNPDFINILKKENRYWFYRFWLEYDGKTHNRTAIEREQELLKGFEEKCRCYEQRLDTTDKELKDAEKKLAEHQSNLNKLMDDRSLLQPIEFNISEISDVLHCMEKNNKLNS
jgi:hypothetical protein